MSSTSIHKLEEAPLIVQDQKRRKLYQQMTIPMPSESLKSNSNGTLIDNSNGTMTPIASTKPMEIDSQEYIECPCGHMHGPGQGDHHDIHAVGLASVPLLRGD